ncbi:MAG: nucleotidyltransferase domain-containing protein [Rhodoferax sp.]|nr:nucleotidyltransferase domain-containing protein [Rhodoferax sp.]
MLELAATQLQQIQHLLAQRLPHVYAVAFGSRIKGWPSGHGSKPYSDLDIALWGVRSVDDIALANLRSDLEESSLPWRVDVNLAQDLPASLRQLIERHGVTLHGQPDLAQDQALLQSFAPKAAPSQCV